MLLTPFFSFTLCTIPCDSYSTQWTIFVFWFSAVGHSVSKLSIVFDVYRNQKKRKIEIWPSIREMSTQSTHNCTSECDRFVIHLFTSSSVLYRISMRRTHKMHYTHYNWLCQLAFVFMPAAVSSFLSLSLFLGPFFCQRWYAKFRLTIRRALGLHLFTQMDEDDNVLFTASH